VNDSTATESPGNRKERRAHLQWIESGWSETDCKRAKVDAEAIENDWGETMKGNDWGELWAGESCWQAAGERKYACDERNTREWSEGKTEATEGTGDAGVDVAWQRVHQVTTDRNGASAADDGTMVWSGSNGWQDADERKDVFDVTQRADDWWTDVGEWTGETGVGMASLDVKQGTIETAFGPNAANGGAEGLDGEDEWQCAQGRTNAKGEEGSNGGKKDWAHESSGHGSIGGDFDDEGAKTKRIVLPRNTPILESMRDVSRQLQMHGGSFIEAAAAAQSWLGPTCFDYYVKSMKQLAFETFQVKDPDDIQPRRVSDGDSSNYRRIAVAIQRVCNKRDPLSPADEIRRIIIDDSYRPKTVDVSMVDIGKVPDRLNSAQRHAIKLATSMVLVPVLGPPGTGKSEVAVQILLKWVDERKAENRQTMNLIAATAYNHGAVDNLLEALLKTGRNDVIVYRLGPPAEVGENLQKKCLPQCGDVTTYLRKADIIFCTTMFAQNQMLEENKASPGVKFTDVLIDEAAQQTEISTLVALAKKCRRAVLVGDHHQLTAEVRSSAAKYLGMSTSLFERLAGSRVPPAVLDVQYRMHPRLMDFSNDMVYVGSKITHGVEAKEVPLGFSWPNSDVPICVIDVDGREDKVDVTRKDGSVEPSFANEDELSIVYRIISVLLDRGGMQPEDVGVITPYAGQRDKLITKLSSLQPRSLPGSMRRFSGAPKKSRQLTVASVDGFQGQERDIMIISTVRASMECKLSFVADLRRMNVGFTRAKSGMIVVCNATVLGRDEVGWRYFLGNAERADPPYLITATDYLTNYQ
jgi:regulator of nonsense transcripts 1